MRLWQLSAAFDRLQSSVLSKTSSFSAGYAQVRYGAYEKLEVMEAVSLS